METVLVKFLRDFDYHVDRKTIAYKAGMLIEVDLDCASFAMDCGAAEQAFDDPIFDPDTSFEEDAAD